MRDLGCQGWSSDRDNYSPFAAGRERLGVTESVKETETR